MASVSILEEKPILVKKIEHADFSVTEFHTTKRMSVINQVLPFRIRFTSVQVPGYSSNNVPPIPLQIIGYSNYIL